MTHYIDKSAVVAEIEKIIADETESIKSFEHSKNVSEVQRSNARMGVLMHIRSLLDTIEVKEVISEQEGLCNGIFNRIIGNTWNLVIPIDKVGLKHGDKVKILIAK